MDFKDEVLFSVAILIFLTLWLSIEIQNYMNTKTCSYYIIKAELVQNVGTYKLAKRGIYRQKSDFYTQELRK